MDYNILTSLLRIPIKDEHIHVPPSSRHPFGKLTSTQWNPQVPARKPKVCTISSAPRNTMVDFRPVKAQDVNLEFHQPLTKKRKQNTVIWRNFKNVVDFKEAGIRPLVVDYPRQRTEFRESIARENVRPISIGNMKRFDPKFVVDCKRENAKIKVEYKFY